MQTFMTAPAELHEYNHLESPTVEPVEAETGSYRGTWSQKIQERSAVTHCTAAVTRDPLTPAVSTTQMFDMRGKPIENQEIQFDNNKHTFFILFAFSCNSSIWCEEDNNQTPSE